MPGFSALNDVARELQAQFVSALSGAPDIDFSVSNTNLILGPPSDDPGPGVVASLYLYHINIDPHLRNHQSEPDVLDPTLMIPPPLFLQFRFLFVPLAKNEDHNQLMLGRILQHFHDHPTFQPVPGSPLAAHRSGAPEQIRVRYDLASHSELAALWSGFSRPYRLSAGFLVETLAIDSSRAAQKVPRVGTVYHTRTVTLQEQSS